jgi:MFS family permease
MTDSTGTRPTLLLTTNLRWFMLAMILANIAGQMAYSMLSLYLVDMGATVGQVGLVFTVASLVPMALQILGGWLSDSIGRLRAIALGSAIAVVGYLLFWLAPSWLWVMVGLCIEYVSNSVVGPSYSAYIAEQSTEANRGRIFGLTRGIYMTVTVIGPALAGFLAYRLGFRPMLQVAFVFYASATALRVWMALAERFAPTRTTRPTWSGLRTQMGAMAALLVAGGILTWIWITDAVVDTASNMTSQLYPLYLSQIGGLNPSQIGLLNAAAGGAIIVSSLLAGWLTDRVSERAVIAGGFLVEGLGVVLLLQTGGFWAMGAAMVVFGLGAGAMMPAYDSMISKVVPEDKRGLAFGLFGTSLGILSLPFPWIGAQLWERIGPPAPFWIMTITCLVSIPIVWIKFVRPREGPAPAADAEEGGNPTG